jgi:ornithine cyclodeaminase/alanine dehydrogenase-like protein (mu-crystallin family)
VLDAAGVLVDALVDALWALLPHPAITAARTAAAAEVGRARRTPRKQTRSAHREMLLL